MPAGAVAVAQGVDALVLDDALEVAQHPLLRLVVVAHQLGERLLRRLRDQRAARVEVTDEPLEGEAVDQRHDRIGDGRERKGEGYDETQRERHGAPRSPCPQQSLRRLSESPVAPSRLSLHGVAFQSMLRQLRRQRLRPASSRARGCARPAAPGCSCRRRACRRRRRSSTARPSGACRCPPGRATKPTNLS